MVNSRFLKGIRLFKNPWAKKGSHRAMLPLAPVMRVVNSKGPSRSMNPKTSAQSGEHPVSLAEDLSITAFALLEGLCSFVFVVGRDGTIRYATPSVFRQTGVEPSKCVGHPFVAAPFWSEATAQEDIAVGLRDAFQGRKADFLVDISTLSKRITVNFDCKPLRSAEGIIEAILVEGHDVTDRRLLERKLRDSHFHWRTIADCAVDWEFWLHPAGYFIYNSPSCQRITGYSIDELTQNRITINSMAHPDDRKRVTELLTAAYSGTTGHSQRFRIVRRDGSARSVSMSWQPVQGDDGRFLGIRGSVRDVTDLADTEAELQRLLEAYRILALPCWTANCDSSWPTDPLFNGSKSIPSESSANASTRYSNPPCSNAWAPYSFAHEPVMRYRISSNTKMPPGSFTSLPSWVLTAAFAMSSLPRCSAAAPPGMPSKKNQPAPLIR